MHELNLLPFDMAITDGDAAEETCRCSPETTPRQD
jgi:hypothetical protein